MNIYQSLCFETRKNWMKKKPTPTQGPLQIKKVSTKRIGRMHVVEKRVLKACILRSIFLKPANRVFFFPKRTAARKKYYPAP
jgi:hypothetical protein